MICANLCKTNVKEFFYHNGRHYDELTYDSILLYLGCDSESGDHCFLHKSNVIKRYFSACSTYRGLVRDGYISNIQSFNDTVVD